MKISKGLQARLEEMAEELREEFGSVDAEQYDCLFSAIEDRAASIGDQLARSLMAKGVLAVPPAEHAHRCPKCQREGYRKADRERSLSTRRGELKIQEPEYYCPGCRRSFFPSDARAGH